MRPETPETSVLRFGAFELDPTSGELRKAGHPVKLQPQPSKVLALLVSRAGQLVTRAEIQQEVWGKETYVDFEHGLNFCIRQIRAALGDDTDTPRYIGTVPRRGYRFLAPVTRADGTMAFPVPVGTISGLVGPLARRRFVWLAVTLVTAVLLVAAYVAWLRFRPGARPPAGKIILAVLPFENLSGQPEENYFSEGLTDELITQLGSLDPERLAVIARASARKYKDAPQALKQAGGALAVDYILEGSVLRTRDRLRIHAQLVEVRTQTYLWAKSLEVSVRDILAVQGEVAQAIATEIHLTLTPQQRARLALWRPVDPKAYEAYLKGRYFWNKRTEEGFLKARKYFEQAIEDDPSYPLAYVGLADAYLGLGEYGVLPLREAMPRAKAAAMKALEMDDTLAEAHATLVGIRCDFDWDWAAAEREFKRAIELNPGYATAHQWYAEYLLWMGRFDESKAEMKRAQELDPLSLIINRNAGLPLFFERKYDQAIEHFRKSLEMDPNFWAGHLILGWTYEQKGEFSQAIAEYQTARQLTDSTLVFAHLAHAYALSGKRREAGKLLVELKAKSKQRYVSPLEIAMIYAGLGEKDQTFAWLEKGYEGRSDWMAQLRVDPRWDHLRSDPRFQDLLRRVGLPP